MRRFSRAYLKTFRYDRAFAASALAVMAPITVQQLISTLFNVVDGVMVGRLDAISMTAVTVANRPYLIYFGVMFGVTGGAGLLISQFYGAGDREQCQSLFSIELLINLAGAVIFCALMLLIPEPIARLFVADEATIAKSAAYMRSVSLSYLFVAFSSTCLFSLRALGHNRLPMLVSMATMGLNALLNYLLIFGKFGFPALGVVGAGLGTLFSRAAESVIYLVLLARGRSYFAARLTPRRIRPDVLRSFITRAVPLSINEVLFQLGQTAVFWAYARIDEAALPAVAASEQAYQIGTVVSIGMSSAVAVLVGAILGAGDFALARKNAKRLLALVFTVSLIGMAAGCGLAFVLPRAYEIGDELRRLATRLTVMQSLFYPVVAVYAYSYFLLRAGGDAKATLILDACFLWTVPIPLAVLLALFAKGSVDTFTAMLLVNAATSLRLILSYRFVTKGTWVKNITVREGVT